MTTIKIEQAPRKIDRLVPSAIALFFCCSTHGSLEHRSRAFDMCVAPIFLRKHYQQRARPVTDIFPSTRPPHHAPRPDPCQFHRFCKGVGVRSDTGLGEEYKRQLGFTGIRMRMSEPHQRAIVLGGNRARTFGFRHGFKATQTMEWKFNLFCLHL